MTGTGKHRNRRVADDVNAWRASVCSHVRCSEKKCACQITNMPHAPAKRLLLMLCGVAVQWKMICDRKSEGQITATIVQNNTITL